MESNKQTNKQTKQDKETHGAEFDPTDTLLQFPHETGLSNVILTFLSGSFRGAFHNGRNLDVAICRRHIADFT